MRYTAVVVVLLSAVSLGSAQQMAQPQGSGPGVHGLPPYLLGPGDQIVVRVLDVPEITDQPIRIDADGSIRLPLAGRMAVGGLTLKEAETAVTERLRTYVLEPEVSLAIAEYGSQPVTVTGAVRNPGVFQLQGQRTLLEVLSMAGGVDQAVASSTIKLTRRVDQGRIPLPSEVQDPTGAYSVAEVSLTAILKAERPEENVVLAPYDIISIPRAELVYVMGKVHRAGGFPLNEEKTTSVLKALSLAGGTDAGASPKNAVLLRRVEGSSERQEIPVDVRKILTGRAPDVTMIPGDLLFIPDSAPRRVALRAVEAAIQLGTGIVIWRR